MDVLIVMLLAGLGHDDCLIREITHEIVQVLAMHYDWREPLDAAITSEDAEVRHRAKEIMYEYESIPCKYPLIENLAVPLKYKEEKTNLLILAITSEFSWSFTCGMQHIRNNENRINLSEHLTIRMIREGMTRTQAIDMLAKSR